MSPTADGDGAVSLPISFCSNSASSTAAVIEAAVVIETNDDASDNFMMMILCLRVREYKNKCMEEKEMRSEHISLLIITSEKNK